MKYSIIYLQTALKCLKRLTVNQQSLIVEGIEEQLAHQPEVTTKNRKPLRSNPVASWELRIDDLRVFYDIKEGYVVIRAVGVKNRNKLLIENKEFIL
jgi:mRNA-degrading endonuclease RelE of RelBE toxin-antitoxin system